MRLSDCPGYWRTWSASTISGFGSYVTRLAVQVLVVVTLHGGAAEVGVVNAAGWLPYLLFGLVAGVVADRSRRRPVLVGTDLGRAVLLGALPVLAYAHRLQLGTLIAVVSVFGVLSLLNDAAFQSFVPRLVPARLLTAAHARLDQSDAVAQSSGPALAGGLVSLVGAPLAVLVDAASYLVSGLLLTAVRADEPPARPMSLRGLRSEVVEGLSWVYRHPMLRPLAVSTHAWFLCTAVTGAIVTPFALQRLHLTAFGLGVTLAVGGCGGLVGSLFAVRLGSRFGAGRVIAACRLGTGLGWAVAALAWAGWSGWLVFGAGQLLLGLALGAENANEMGYRQAVTPDRLQGRMNATMRSLNRAMVVVGAPVGGLLADALGYRVMLWAAAAGFGAVGVALALSGFREART
ncbi:MAG TPA: MFS transporter [Streptosporangiales bacterium]